MAVRRRIRDLDLVDAIDRFERTRFQGQAWRVVSHGRDPLDASRAGGRWDLGSTDVLYTSLEPHGAIAELAYYMSLLPVKPSRKTYVCHEISVNLSSVIRIETIDRLVDLGVDRARYHERLYERTAEIGDAAAFLGCDGLIVPSARSKAFNLMIFVEAVDVVNVSATGTSMAVDLAGL